MLGFARVRAQAPIEAGAADRERSLPEPDLAVLLEAKADYGSRHPNGGELALVIEVADSTLQPDLTTKRDLYARAGVREYWVLDLNGRRLVVHRGVDAARGEYASAQGYMENEAVDFDGRGIDVSAMLV